MHRNNTHSNLYRLFVGLSIVISPISWVVVIVVGAAVAVWQDQSTLVWLSLATIVTSLLADVIKVIVKRPRPQSDYINQVRLSRYSFPSTHAYMAALGGGYVTIYLSQYLPTDWLGWLLAVAIALAVTVAAARVYLKAHHLSDVVAGVLLGGLVSVFLWWLVVGY